MDRRKFLKWIAFLPLIFWVPKASPGPANAETAQSKEIVLLEMFVAGWQYHEGDRDWRKLLPDTPLTLRREPDNPYDDRAIAIYGKGVKLGYVPRADNTVIAGMMDQSIPAKAHVLWRNKSPHPWERLEIRVTMTA